MHARLMPAIALLSCAALAAPSLANPGGGFSWSFQATSLTTSSSSVNVTVSMRNGLAWPVVVIDSSTNNPYGSSATLFPTVATGASGSPATNWQNIGSGFFATPSAHVRAVSSPDGRVAFAAADPAGNALGGRVSSATGGWGALPAGTKAVAFDSAGTLYTATATAVSGVGGYAGAPIVDLAVSPAKEVGVVSFDMKFSQYSAWLGTWTSATLSTSAPSPESQDVEYDSLGRPHVIATFNNSLVAFDFNTVTGAWASTTIATNLPSSNTTRATLAANADGTVGTAYVDSSGLLVYAYKHDLDNWASSIVTSTGSSSTSGGQVGIAYDYAGLPVLAYRNNIGNIVVAYDPVVVPEPACLGLAAIAVTALTRRARRA